MFMHTHLEINIPPLHTAMGLFIPGPMLPKALADDLNDNLAGGIPWSHGSALKMIENIAFILTHLGSIISPRPTMPQEFSRMVWREVDTLMKACKSGN
jgi:hypothetical protein